MSQSQVTSENALPLLATASPGWRTSLSLAFILFVGSLILGSLANKPAQPEYEKEAIAGGDFPQVVLDGVRAHGQAIKMVSTYDQPGYWVGIQIDPESRKLRGGATPLLPALVEGY